MSVLRVSPTIYTEWQITDFNNLPKETDYYLESPAFSISGASWYISIYPNGESEYHTSFRWVGLYLNIRNSAKDYRVSFRCGIKRADGVELEYFEDEDTFSKREQYRWGPSALFKRSTLNSTQNVLASDGSLTVFCSIRILNGPFILPAKEAATQISSSTATILEAATQTSSSTATILEAATQTPSSTVTTLEAATQTPSSNVTTLEAATQTPSLYTILKAATQTPSQASTQSPSQAASQSSSLNSLTEKTSLQSPSLESMLTLVEDFENIYRSKLYTDVTFTVKGEKFSVHRSVLESRSPVFASMFKHDFAEKSSGTVEINDCDPDLFDQFLLFLYTGKVDDIAIFKAVYMYLIADKYNVNELKEKCVRFIVCNVSIDSFCDVLYIAVMHNDSDLMEAATDFFINNLEFILPTTKWQDFLTEHPLLCNELLIQEIKHRMAKK